jgi:hypothetical protein
MAASFLTDYNCGKKTKKKGMEGAPFVPFLVAPRKYIPRKTIAALEK